MSPLALRRSATRVRHRSKALVATLFVALAIVAHHASIGPAEDAHHGLDLGAVADLCLGVFTAVGATVAAVALVVVRLSRRRPVRAVGRLRRVAVSRLPAPRVRAGPELLLVLCISRC